MGQHHARWASGARIVSLVPSITELICDLGLSAQLVGRTGFCIHPRDIVRRIPKVGGTKDVKLARIRALEPTHVIVNIDENPKPIADALAAWVPHVVVTHPCMPEDNRALYRLLGGIFDRDAAAARLVAEFDAALAAARAVGQRLRPENVLYLIWRAPWMTVAPQTYVSATLAAVGWHTQPAAAALRYPEFGWDAPWLKGVERVLDRPAPVCHLRGFGDSALNMELRVWIQDPQNGVANVTNQILLRIWDAFQEAGIGIPFPQQDVYIKSGSVVNVGAPPPPAPPDTPAPPPADGG